MNRSISLWLPYLAVILALVTISAGYALNRAGLISFLAGGAGLLWLFGLSRAAARVNTLAFSVVVMLAALGVGQGAGLGWMLTGLLAALAAWDLAGFGRRLEQAGYVEQLERLQQAHLKRLGLVIGLSLAAALLARFVQLPLNLGGAILLGLLIIVGLGRLVREA